MEIANVEMAKAWDGEEGDDWTVYADRFDACGRAVWEQFLARVRIEPADAVLDIGCGTGQSTRDVARQATSAFGVDLGSSMLELARKRAADEGLTNVEFAQGDAQVYPLASTTYDLAISRFGAMFFADPVAAFTNIRGAVRDGGGMALLAWQPFERNEWIRTFFDVLSCGRDLAPPPPGVSGPFGLADPDGVRSVLGAAGFNGVELIALEEPQWLGANADDAWAFVSKMGIVRGLTGALDTDTKEDALDRLRAAVAAHEGPNGVEIGAAQWLITARA